MKNNECTKYHSNIQEKRVSKKVAGKVVIGSGATPFMKADVTTADILYECKTNTKGQQKISVQKAWYEKVKKEAYSMGKPMYAVVISFGDGMDYYSVDEDNWKTMLEGYEKLNQILEVLDDEDYLEDEKMSKVEKIVRGKY